MLNAQCKRRSWARMAACSAMPLPHCLPYQLHVNHTQLCTHISCLRADHSHLAHATTTFHLPGLSSVAIAGRSGEGRAASRAPSSISFRFCDLSCPAIANAALAVAYATPAAPASNEAATMTPRSGNWQGWRSPRGYDQYYHQVQCVLCCSNGFGLQ